MKEIGEVVATIFPLTKEEFDALQNLEKLAGDRQQDAGARTLIIEYLVKLAREKYEVLQSSLVELSGNEKAMRVLESQIMLGSIDNLWIEHLDAIDALRSGIGLRGYGQRDPLIEYQREAKQMFIQLLNLINKQVVYSVYKLGAAKEINSSVPKNVQENFNPSPTQFGSDPYKGAKRVEQKPIVAGAKVGRNEPCPCGSGKKYKKCCGE
jgi:preprotein translocase subunit SecA